MFFCVFFPSVMVSSLPLILQASSFSPFHCHLSENLFPRSSVPTKVVGHLSWEWVGFTVALTVSSEGVGNTEKECVVNFSAAADFGFNNSL